MHVEIRQYINTSISKIIIDVIFDIRCTVHVGAYMRVVVYVCVCVGGLCDFAYFSCIHQSHLEEYNFIYMSGNASNTLKCVANAKDHLSACQHVQEFLKVFCENDDFLAQRRKVLRLRAGLRDEDRRLVFISAGQEWALR